MFDGKGIIHFELLDSQQTPDLYCQQLELFNEALQKRPSLVHRRGREFYSMTMCAPTWHKELKKSENWNGMALPHLPHSSDITPTD